MIDIQQKVKRSPFSGLCGCFFPENSAVHGEPRSDEASPRAQKTHEGSTAGQHKSPRHHRADEQGIPTSDWGHVSSSPGTSPSYSLHSQGKPHHCRKAPSDLLPAPPSLPLSPHSHEARADYSGSADSSTDSSTSDRSGRSGSSHQPHRPAVPPLEGPPHEPPHGWPPLGETRLGPLDYERVLRADQVAPPQVFGLAELRAATDWFDPERILGRGGYGNVYKGWLRGADVAVKVLESDGMQGFNEWLNEVFLLKQLHDPHLVRLVGYCVEGNLGCLVYEYMPLCSLDYHLFGERGMFLKWADRVKVALGAAKGLAYLHQRTSHKNPVIFRDFKTGNVLLDEDFNAKLSDFGLAKEGPSIYESHVLTKICGTLGYTAPEYMSTGRLTLKNDVYAFGIVLLELLTGRRAVDRERPKEEHLLVDWVQPYLHNRAKLPCIIDPRLNGTYPIKYALKLAMCASACVVEDPSKRPTMEELVEAFQAMQR